MASLFTRIVRGEIPCHRVAENEQFLAFLDIAPLREGHTLVIPKVEVDKFFETAASQPITRLPIKKRSGRAANGRVSRIPATASPSSGRRIICPACKAAWPLSPACTRKMRAARTAPNILSLRRFSTKPMPAIMPAPSIPALTILTPLARQP